MVALTVLHSEKVVFVFLINSKFGKLEPEKPRSAKPHESVS